MKFTASPSSPLKVDVICRGIFSFFHLFADIVSVIDVWLRFCLIDQKRCKVTKKSLMDEGRRLNR